MPRRKTADVVSEVNVPAAEPKKRTTTSVRKSPMSTTAAAKHKRAATPVVAAEPVESSEPTVQASVRPSQEEIARLAYSYYEQRGFQHGDHQEDWFRAERELLAKLA